MVTMDITSMDSADAVFSFIVAILDDPRVSAAERQQFQHFITAGHVFDSVDKTHMQLSPGFAEFCLRVADRIGLE